MGVITGFYGVAVDNPKGNTRNKNHDLLLPYLPIENQPIENLPTENRAIKSRLFSTFLSHGLVLIPSFLINRDSV